MPKRDHWVTASEIGSYVYCSRQYWLAKVKKVRPPKGRGRDRLKQGTRKHHRHGVSYDWQLRLRRLGLWLLLVAMLVGIAFLALSGGIG